MSRSDYDIAHQTWNHDRPAPTLRWPHTKPDVACEQCGKACYTSKSYRQIERNRGKENWMNLCWDCIDEIVREAFQ